MSRPPLLVGRDDELIVVAGLVDGVRQDKTETDRAAMTSCWRGERAAQFRESRRRLGTTREAVFIQHTPGGDVVVVYQEAEDLRVAVLGMVTSQDPFDRWFRDHVSDVHGVDLEDGFPRPSR